MSTEEIPAGTTVVKERQEATANSPAIERETTTYNAQAKRVIEEDVVEAVVANERAPDQTVALHKADSEERRPLLYAGMGLAALAGILLYLRQKDIALLPGSLAAASFGLWYAPWLIIPAAGLVACGAAWLIYSQHRAQKKAAKTEEALRRTVQTVEELKIDSPSVAKELSEYQSSNLDMEHKELIEKMRSTINDKYIREQLAKASSHSL